MRAGQYLPEPTGYSAFHPAPLPPSEPHLDMTQLQLQLRHAEQLDLFGVGAPTEVAPGSSSGLPDRSATARYLHLIRAPDPERAPRGDHGSTDWRRVNEVSVSSWPEPA